MKLCSKTETYHINKILLHRKDYIDSKQRLQQSKWSFAMPVVIIIHFNSDPI